MNVLSKISACEAAMKSMSSFIDSMVTVEESERLRLHLSGCESCRRQLHSFVSLRNVVGGAESVPVPEGLQRGVRMRLSRERTFSRFERWRVRADNMLRPVAFPAVTGFVLTLACFGLMLGGLFAPHPALSASTHGSPAVAIYAPPRTTDRTLRRFEASAGPKLDQPISVQTEICGTGRICGFNIVSGKRSVEVDQWLQEMLLLAEFRPATNWGAPVPSQVVISFITVRG